jgi:ABC-2 type transport system permease protein/oleandomycin transport system permease protein
MSTIVTPVKLDSAEPLTSRFRWALSDTSEMVKRNLRHIPHSPELLIDVTIQPVIFVLLFRYIFGGAINVAGTSYVNYLMAGIFVQTIIFASMTSGIGLAYDLQKGLIDRFRSLPMSRAAVVAGRTITDLLRGCLAVVVMFGVGLVVGFRPEGNPLAWLGGFALLVLVGFAWSWVGVTFGMLVKAPEAVQATVFILVLPFTFASSAFVPVETMPSWLATFAENQPVTAMIDTLRHVFLGQPVGNSAWFALAWAVGILVVFFPIAIYMYQRRTTE